MSAADDTSPGTGSDSPELEAIFPGDGEMARLMRARDWSETAVGPVAGWPQSLRTSVSILLKSHHPMCLWWGPALVQFYNDGFRPSLGAHKHPAALGQLGHECWAEIWPIIGPQIEAVMVRDEATWHEDQLVPFDRNGFLEEIYFTYSYSPIREEGGRVGGILVVCSETTDRVLGERRLRTLGQISARAGSARRVDAVCDLAAESLRENAEDLPFALLYLTAGDGDEARLAGATGLEPWSEHAPAQIPLVPGAAPWPLADAMAGEEALELGDLAARIPGAALGPWPERPHTALLLPLADRGHDRPLGVLVVGLSARLPADERYREFLGLVASQISAAITGARAYESERRRAEALAELDRAKTAFFSNVSHEFRTPLTLTLGPLEDALDLPEPRLEGEALASTHRNAQRLLLLVNTLLDFARLEAGRFQARYEPVDLPALTTDLASAFRSLVERAGLELSVACPPLPEPLWVDRESWEKIVLNLVSNAFKFTLEGSITVALAERDREVVLEVRDTGTGIAPDELPHIFDRFHRVQGARSRSFEGSGIGLALVAELVERHGGTIDVESEVGAGTTFRVAIPKGKEHLPEDQIADPRAAPAGEAGEADGAAVAVSLGAQPFVEEALRWLPGADPGQGAAGADPVAAPEATILVVDDNADMRAYLERLLGGRWRVLTAPDGASALARIRAERPDLVLSDVMMPELDGFGLLRAVRADPAIAATPVILVSARAGEEANVVGLEAGADAYLAKPFSARELLARVESQLALAVQRHAARSYRDLLHDLIANAPASIAMLRGRDLVYELVNPTYQRIVGERRELIGRPLAECLPELVEQGFVPPLLHVLDSGEPWEEREMAIALDREDTGERVTGYFNFVIQRVPGVGGEPDGLAAFGFDVTELVAARKRTEDLAARAQEEARHKDEFLAMLSHELRNPLAPMASAIEILRSEPLPPPEDRRRWAVEVLERQIRQLARLVDDLLDIARISRGTIRLQRRPSTLQEIVQTALETVQPFVQGRNHELTVELPDEAVPLEADALRTAQVIGNLLHNAAKYTPTGGHIELSAAVSGNQVELVVADDGEGIDAELLPHIFDLFTHSARTLDRSGAGLGIGLTIVRRLVEMQGGTVVATSPGPGAGSRFTVRLPLAIPSPAGALEPRLGAGAGTPLRILVVDDRQDAAASLGLLLEFEGHEVRVEHSGEAAIAAARELAPQVALLDIGLPEMDGYQLARRLRDAHGDAVRLVAVTGYGLPGDREKAAAAGFDEHVVKPVDFTHLRRLLAGFAPAAR